MRMHHFHAALFAAGLFFQAHGQAVYLKGVVADLGTGKPIASAIVQLPGSKLSDTTGADGVFLLTKIGTGIGSRVALRSNSLRITPSGFLVDMGASQEIVITIRDLSGKVVHSQNKFVVAGSNFIQQPRLEKGAYLTTMVSSEGAESRQFLVLSEGGAKEMANSANGSSYAGRFAGTLFNDSLIVTAPGYDAYRNAISTPVDSNLSIKLSAGAICGQNPADPKANSKVKQLICYLRTHSFVTGQTNDYAPDLDKIKSMTGRYPAIGNFEMANWTTGSIGTQDAINWFNTHKGIVSFQWHWNCPYGGNYSANCDYQNDLTNSGSKLYKDIDLIVRELKKIGDAGVPVLFRPLHEANNNYMWWAKKGQDNYKKLFRLIYDRAQLAGAHNLVWVFNGMISGSGANSDMKTWYPGDDVVDVISGDYTQSWNDYNSCKAMGNGNKITAIAETMNQLNPAKDPPFAYSAVWASRDWNGNSANDWTTAMKDPKSITIDQLPDITKW